MNDLDKLRSVPLPIRHWFGSEEIIDLIEGIERQFGLPEDEVDIPELLFELEVRELPLDELAEELEYALAVSPEVARAIYEEIKVKILLPIAPELVAFGIGTTELAAFAPKPAAPAAADAAPRNVTTLPSAMPTPPARPAGAPAAPAAAPVPLYRDALASQPVPAPRASWTIGGGSGDISGRTSAAPQPLRPAQIDLGASSARVDETLRSIFVQRETPKPQEIDYGASRAAAAPATAIISPTPVPLAAVAPQAPDPGPAVAPRVEVVTLTPAPAAEPVAEKAGLVDSLIRRVAPWHHAKFGAARARATEALETPVPSKEVDYAADAAPQPAQPAAPLPKGATPLPLDDLPQPPSA